MAPTNFPQANTVFRPPSDLDESQCSPIPAFVGTMLGGNLDGSNVVVVAWKPSMDERIAIAQGAPVFLMCMGQCLPPHFIATEFPK